MVFHITNPLREREKKTKKKKTNPLRFLSSIFSTFNILLVWNAYTRRLCQLLKYYIILKMIRIKFDCGLTS